MYIVQDEEAFAWHKKSLTTKGDEATPTMPVPNKATERSGQPSSVNSPQKASIVLESLHTYYVVVLCVDA